MEYKILSGKSIPIYSIICNSLKEGNEGKNIGKILNNPCNTLSLQISRSLIKVASTRIFSNPYQSILELPVNSIDSYAELQGRPSIGKFGLGFYSILYWVITTPGCKLVINSTVSGYTWTGTIFKKNDDLYLDFVLKLMDTKKMKRGTTIRLSGAGYNTIARFREELDKLIYIKNTKIYINNAQINPKVSSKDKIMIRINLNEGYVEVEDFAGGITLPVLFNSLLIPTISTKSVSRSLTYNIDDINTLDNNIIIKEDKPYFSILVGNVEVKRIKIDDKNMAVILSLPLETRLPTSRDDVILDDNVKPYVLKALDKILNMSLSERDVRPLQYALQAYISSSSNSYNRKLFADYLKMIDEKVKSNKYIVVLDKYFKLYTSLSEGSPNPFIRSISYNPIELDNFLELQYGKYINKDVYYGKNVMFIKNIYEQEEKVNVTSGGTTKTIFISEDIVDTDKDWITNIPTSITNDVLIPADFIITLDNNKNIKRLSQLPGSDLSKNLLKSLLLKLSSLDIYYSFNSMQHMYPDDISYSSSMNIWNLFVMDYYTFMNMERENELQEYLLLWFQTIPNLIPTNNAYGSNLPEFNTILRRSQSTDYNKIPHITQNLDQFMYDSEDLVNRIYSDLESYRLPYIKDIFKYQCQFSKFMVEVMNKESPTYYSSILFPSPLFFLKYKYVQNYYETIIQLSDNFYEFIIMSMIISFNNISYNISESFIVDAFKILKDEYITQDLELIIKNILVDRNPYPLKLGDIHGRLLKHQNILKELKSGYNYNFEIEKITSIPIQTKLQNIIAKIFKFNVGPKENYFDVISDANNYTLDRKLQLIEVTVNENTTKSPLEASLTELIQNSVDAINNTPSSNKRIDINVSRDPSLPILNVIVHDDVGIPDSSMLSLSVPFVSSKTGDTSVGQIGTGFFNVYRDTHVVTIDTYKDGIRTTIIDIPIRDEFNRVIDISKTIFRQKSKEGNGTNIILSIKYNNERDRNIDEGHVSYICKTIISKTLSPPDIYLNNILLTSSYSPLLKYQSLDFLTKTEEYESYVLTRGIPYTKLSWFYPNFNIHSAFYDSAVSEVLNKNLCINFIENFTPASNRTSLTIDNKYIDNIRKSIQNGIYLSVLWKISQHLVKNPNYFIPNYTSIHGRQTGFVIMTDFSRIVNISTFMVNYQPEDYVNGNWIKYKSIAHGINTIITSKNKENRDETIESLRESYHPLQYSIIKRWIATKTDLDEKNAPPLIPLTLLPTTTQPRKVDLETNDDEVEYLVTTSSFVVDNIEELQKFFEAFVSAFWIIASEKIKTPIYKNKGIPKINIGPDVESRHAYYSPKLHIISINSSKLDDIVNIIIDLSSSKDENTFKDNWLKYRNDNKFKEYFGYVFPSSNIVHELEHARRQSEHSSISHSEIIDESIGGKNPISFNDSANKVYDIILQNNFVSNVYKYLKS
ncbi:Histidine kinase-like ATPase [Orpheovirus IHUMI-LCC2]|uniref:Histidine kinase-like ATPase n=1 Tax=Orpheovirus IHUMI-LCC2 TaxID=2023057 RepID=A0A2I2L6C7_9VIRU|nr:Histidine kinase-like ATPase [Orpheovirus IHUMI-LCC2]SNW63102.1 Histidine kinase-like ATPase [Orpheovirus IHUMI-LCC2]